RCMITAAYAGRKCRLEETGESAREAWSACIAAMLNRWRIQSIICVPCPMRRSRASAPTGRDSLSFYGFVAYRITLFQGCGKFWDRFPGLAPWAIESRTIRGFHGESTNRIGIRFDDPNVRALSTSGTLSLARNTSA